MKKMNQEQAITTKYASDKPKDCKYCYWWGGRNKGCTLGEENCYYILPPAEKKKLKSPCDGCPYGKTNPCIGFCMKEILGSRKAGK